MGTTSTYFTDDLIEALPDRVAHPDDCFAQSSVYHIIVILFVALFFSLTTTFPDTVCYSLVDQLIIIYFQITVFVI